MTTSAETRIRDFTRPAEGLSVSVASHPATDLLLTLMALSWEDLTDYDLGEDWFNGAREGMSELTVAAIEATTRGQSKVWFGFFHLVTDGPEGESVHEFLDRLESMDPMSIRIGLIENLIDRSKVGSETVERAAQGDEAALTEVVTCCGDLGELENDLRELLRRDPVQSKQDLMTALTGFHTEVFHDFEEQYAAIIERDSRAKQAMVATMSPERVIEESTNGISIEPGSGVRTVMLVPSVVMRPWVLILEQRDTRVFVYPVADEHMTTDCDTPSPWIVKTYKALSDEKRIRILRKLAAGPASFQDLVSYLDAAKSTVHHHLRVLRSARLIRVTLGAEKEYSLTTGVITEAANALEEFVAAGATRSKEK